MEIGKKQRDPKKSLSRQVVDSIEEMIMERKLGWIKEGDLKLN